MNLCISNLLNAVFVKSLSTVHNAYAVTANTTMADIALCSVGRISDNVTGVVLPYSVVVLTWLTVIPRIKRLQVVLVGRHSHMKCIVTNPTTTSIQRNLTTTMVGFDTKMTLHHHHHNPFTTMLSQVHI